MDDLRAELERVREELLDLSLRNPLLNFRAYRRSTVEVRAEVPREVYRRLVLQGRKMAFTPREDGDGEAPSDEAPDLLWELPPPGADLEDKHTDRFLDTEHPERDLQKRLFHIDNKARTLIEDAGYNALHLAVGFLSWREEPDADEVRRAPLMLIPVQLEREKARSSFKVQWTGQDLDTNLSLKIRLEEQGIELPELGMPEEPEGVYRYLEEVRRRIPDTDGWEVEPEIALGFFRFTNLSMYKDLDPEEWPEGQAPHEHRLVRTILDPTQAEPGTSEVDVDVAGLDPDEVNHVLDADPSQAAVIEAVKRGEDLVVEGPPGTGKSQTIVNLIAELMAQGKKVLFVSEKKAALDVVHGKLDAVGLGDFCLELHSHKANKGEILSELQRVAFQEPMGPEPDEGVDRDLERVEAELDGYAAAIREPIAETGLAPFELVNRRQEAREHFEGDGRELEIVDLPHADAPEAARREAVSRLDDFVEAIEPVWPVDEHPWRGTRPGTVLPRKRRRVENALDGGLEAAREVREAFDALGEAARVPDSPATPRETATLCKALERLLEARPVEPARVRHEAWERPSEAPARIVEHVREFDRLRGDLEPRFRSRAFEVDLAEIRETYREASSSPFRWFKPSYWEARARVRDLYAERPPRARATLLEDLDDLARHRELEAALEDEHELAGAIFGRRWEGPGTDPDTLEAFAAWVEDVRAAVDEGVLAPASLEVAAEEDAQALTAAMGEARQALGAYRRALDTVLEETGAGAPTLWGDRLSEVPVEAVHERLDAMASTVGRMDDWSTFVGAREAVLETPAGPVAEAVEARRIQPEDAKACFTGNLADALLERAFREREALENFSGDLHERRIEQFRALDERSIDHNRARVRRRLWHERPNLVQGASSASEAGVLVREFRKSQRHLPLRRLMVEAGGLVQDLKPCFMMSPLSVAKYLDPQKVRFDVVIFDEASQVRPQDALGAILRGEQLVVMGDAKQLPPTSFFEAVVERDEDEARVGSLVDLQSILDACEGTLSRRSLRWHYRSRHESLIAVSNSEFYGDRLVIYPSPYQDAAGLGLDFRHHPETTYDRGGSRTNRQEAKEVAQAALAHFREHPDQSLGVGAFSAAQEEAIREEVEVIRKEHPEMDPYFSEDEEVSPFGHEHFMIKNLETIQGDERDVVFVSVGYGFDDEGTLTQNFGPLNHEGGWRRLNVLVTRARNRCVVFSNFTRGDLEVGPKTPRGVQSLARFLAYAKDGQAEGIEARTGDPSTPIDAAVKAFLEDEGYTVHADVGSAGFRMDLAVVDPEEPERYLLGIEHDGPGYSDARVARERDRIRRDVLEDRGWFLHHVWSADWYRSPETAKRRLIDALEEAAEARPDGAPVETRGWEPSAGASRAEAGEGPAEAEIVEQAPEERLVALDELSEPYERLLDPPLPAYDAHTLKDPSTAFLSELADGLARLVEVEGPIHTELAAIRIRDAWGLERAGSSLKRVLEAAVDHARAQGALIEEEGFLWAQPPGELAPRCREDGPELEIAHIPDEEVRGAVDVVLEHQRSTPPGEVASQVAALLGFQRKGQRIEARVEGVLERGLEAGVYERLDDGRLRPREAPPGEEGS